MNNLLLYNGKIHTGDKTYPGCEAVAVFEGKIIAVGSSSELLKEFCSFERIDLNGKRVLPAFTDAHTHFLSYCLKQNQIDLNGINSLEHCLQIIQKRIESTPNGQWIKGSGWNQNLWNPVKYPTRFDLDKISPHHPVCLEARDAHTSWVNSAALKSAGITSSTTFDSTGEILKDIHGNPTGIIKEEARRLIWDVMGEESVEERVVALKSGMKLAYQNGLSGVHCMETIKDFEAYQTLRARNELKLRVNFYLPIRYLDHVIDIGMKSRFGDEWIRFGGMKIFLDGTLGSQTAHMIDRFDHVIPKTCGTEIVDQDKVNELVLNAARHDIACAIHAIGDMANRKALNAFENQKKILLEKKLRQRIEHCQLIHPDDLARFGKLDVIASMQPVHIPEDIDAANKYWGARARWAYPFRSLLSSGAVIALGSDTPIESCNVFKGIHAALRRVKQNEKESWFPEQILNLHEIIYAYTMGAAFASAEENIKGSISQGKVADMMVLSDDIFACTPDDIPTISVEKMIVGGEIVFEV
ncbi:amidohydrolase [bacterium]|nr:amidohydrolase [bacterium]